MAQSYLFLLAFVLAVALAANIPPSADNTDHYRAANNTSLSNNLIIGSRLPGDTLVLRQHVERSSSWLQVLTVEQSFVSPSNHPITQIRALDQKTNGKGAYVSISSGGPGYLYVTLIFRSQRSHGINFAVEVYARP